MLYWFTVDPELPDVLDVGIRNGIWGVPEDEREAIEPLEPGDAILFFQRDHGFVMCEVESEPYTETVPVWPDVDYPHRVRISDPVETDRYAHLAEVHDCLVDPESGEAFQSVSSAEAALSGADGRFRTLSDEEVRCLFRRLGWTLPPDVSPMPEEEAEEAPAAEGEATGEEDELPAGEAEDAEAAGEADEEPEAEDEEGAAEEEPSPDEVPGPAEEVPEPAQARPLTEPDEADRDEPSGEGGVAEATPAAGGEEEPSADEADHGPEAGAEEVPDDEEAAAEDEAAGGAAVETEAPEEAPGVPQVLLAPATGDPESRRRFDETVAEGVEARRLDDRLSDADRDALGVADDADRVRVWGAAADTGGEPRAAWKSTGRGDVVLFVGGGRVFAAARVLLTLHAPEIARDLWGAADDGDVWPSLFFVSEPVSQDIPLGEIAEPAGLEDADAIDRLRLLGPEHSLRVLGAFPEVGLTAPRSLDRASAVRPGADAEPPGAGPEVRGTGAEDRAGPGGVGAMDEARLRVLLFGRRQLGRCALCGRLLPVDLLAVVYVKPLSACTPEELEDVGNNVLPACRLGCAGLFRQGFVVVEEGRVERGREGPLTDPVSERIDAIAGNRCEYWHSGSEPYFRWHAEESRAG